MSSIYKVKLEVCCPHGTSKKAVKSWKRIIPNSAELLEIKTESRKNADYVFFSLDCRNARIFKKFTKRVVGFQYLAGKTLDNKVVNKMLKKKADNPEDVEIVKQMILEKTTVRVVK